MSEEMTVDDPRQKWILLTQTNRQALEGAPEKEQKPSDHTPDLEPTLINGRR